MDTTVCPICKEKEHSILMSREVAHPLWWRDDKPDTTILQYVHCNSCGYIKLHPHFTVDEYEEIYRLTPGLDQTILSDKRRNLLSLRKDFILQFADHLKHDRIIEAGPAHGDFLMMLDMFHERIGIEPSETYSSSVKKDRPELTYYPYIVEEFSSNVSGMASSADLVTACHVLEHSFDPQGFVNELAQLMKKNGYLFIEVPSIEGMAKTEIPLYHNLYFGHVSQFSTSVITRIGVQSGLKPIRVEYTTEHRYPVIRGLFRKEQEAKESAEFFSMHAENIRRATGEAAKILHSALADPLRKKIIVWGCGQDLLDIISDLNDDELRAYHEKVLLADRNPGKQNLVFRNNSIKSPEAFDKEQVDTVIIASRSQLLQIDIGQDAESLFPQAEQLFPYK